MNLILSLFSKYTMREYPIPPVSRNRYSIPVSKDELCLSEDVLLDFRVQQDKWVISSSCDIIRGSEREPACLLYAGEILLFRNNAGDELIAVIKGKSEFAPFEKISLSAADSLTIGRDPSCDIVYDCGKMVSRLHAVISKAGGETYIESQSRNGVYLNGRNIGYPETLKFGDEIDIIGLHMVFLDDLLAVDAACGSMRINRAKCRIQGVDAETTIVTPRSFYPSAETKKLIHRFPREHGDAGTEPDPSEIIKQSYRSKTFWSRTPQHNDFLTCRIGLNDIGLPVTADLRHHRIIGIIGGNGRKGAFSTARSISLQIAHNNSCSDVRLGYIFDRQNPEDGCEWDFAGWLPHVWSEDRRIRYVADCREEAGYVLRELENLIISRKENNTGTDGQREQLTHYVIFVSDARMLQGSRLIKLVSGIDACAGVSVIVLAEYLEQLPAACDLIIENTDTCKEIRGTFEGSGLHISFEPDIAGVEETEKFARSISACRSEDEEKDGTLPERISFLEMFGVHRPEDIPIHRLWASKRTYNSLACQIGVKADGELCCLDMHEKMHGPHAIIAGTTGSGKSELLQTFILSLAANYSPEDVSFCIIDFKGDGMGGMLRELPHMAGQISNLSGNHIKRAMISVKSEVLRRQRLFRAIGVNNINNYTRLYRNGEADVPISHLFIIVDEFAELKMEEPEFMRELISVAQTGRSLGIHLILATQKPAGVVDDLIWSNSRSRICLRVQDRRDSMEVLHRPDAAFINVTGRAYLQVGSDELFDEFQSGYSSAPYDEANPGNTEIVRIITSSGRVEMSDGMLRDRISKAGSFDEEKTRYFDRTELDAVIDLILRTAEQSGAKHADRLWLDPLPEVLYLDDIQILSDNETCEVSDGRQRVVLPAGMWDDPAEQCRHALILEPARTGNIAVCGLPSSGKSAAMQTITYSAVTGYSPDEVSLYLLDFSSGMLGAFRNAPHTMEYVRGDDNEGIRAVFSALDALMKERRELLGGGTFGQFVRTYNGKLPEILLMLDGYASFRESTGDRYERDLIRIMREGAGLGICTVISGGGFGISDIPGRIADNITTALTLSLKDRLSYGDILRTSRIDIFPEKGISGRGLGMYFGRPLEFQIALAEGAADDYQRGRVIDEICREKAKQWEEQTY